MKSCSIHHHVATLVIVLLFNLCCFGKAADRQEEGLGASFIFGDSLVDAGNNNFLSTLSKANIPPNGIDFKASKGTPTGRYTNGRTIGDIIGKLGFDLFMWVMIYILICLYLFSGVRRWGGLPSLSHDILC